MLLRPIAVSLLLLGACTRSAASEPAADAGFATEDAAAGDAGPDGARDAAADIAPLDADADLGTLPEGVTFAFLEETRDPVGGFPFDACNPLGTPSGRCPAETICGLRDDRGQYLPSVPGGVVATYPLCGRSGDAPFEVRVDLEGFGNDAPVTVGLRLLVGGEAPISESPVTLTLQPEGRQGLPRRVAFDDAGHLELALDRGTYLVRLDLRRVAGPQGVRLGRLSVGGAGEALVDVEGVRGTLEIHFVDPAGAPVPGFDLRELILFGEYGRISTYPAAATPTEVLLEPGLHYAIPSGVFGPATHTVQAAPSELLLSAGERPALRYDVPAVSMEGTLRIDGEVPLWGSVRPVFADRFTGAAPIAEDGAYTVHGPSGLPFRLQVGATSVHDLGELEALVPRRDLALRTVEVPVHVDVGETSPADRTVYFPPPNQSLLVGSFPRAALDRAGRATVPLLEGGHYAMVIAGPSDIHGEILLPEFVVSASPEPIAVRAPYVPVSVELGFGPEPGSVPPAGRLRLLVVLFAEDGRREVLTRARSDGHVHRGFALPGRYDVFVAGTLLLLHGETPPAEVPYGVTVVGSLLVEPTDEDRPTRFEVETRELNVTLLRGGRALTAEEAAGSVGSLDARTPFGWLRLPEAPGGEHTLRFLRGVVDLGLTCYPVNGCDRARFGASELLEDITPVLLGLDLR